MLQLLLQCSLYLESYYSKSIKKIWRCWVCWRDFLGWTVAFLSKIWRCQVCWWCSYIYVDKYRVIKRNLKRVPTSKLWNETMEQKVESPLIEDTLHSRAKNWISTNRKNATCNQIIIRKIQTNLISQIIVKKEFF